jgi:hypothetical protein
LYQAATVAEEVQNNKRAQNITFYIKCPYYLSLHVLDQASCKFSQDIDKNLLKELILLQLGRKLSVFNDTLMFSTQFTKAYNSALPKAVDFAPQLRTVVTEDSM